MSDPTGPWSPATPALPPDRVLNSGAVIFPGAFDQHGCPLLVFPVETQAKLARELTEEDLSDFILYVLRLHSKPREECLVSAVADLREASLDVVKRVTGTLLLLERHGRVVHSLYVVLPRHRGVSKHLHRLLLSESSRAPSSAPFKCVFLRDVFELSNYMDRSQLLASLGGYLTYCHQSWVSFVKEIGGFVQAFVAVVRRLPAYISAIQELSTLPVPEEVEPLTLFCSAHQARLQKLRRDLGLDDLLRQCEQILEKFRCPERDPCYQAMVGTHFFTRTALDMLQNYDRITAAVEKVALLWQQAFSKARLQLQVLRLQREAQQILAQMECVWQGALQSYRSEIRSEAAQNSSRAGALWLRFEASVFTHAMALVRRAEDVIHTTTEVVPMGSGWGQEAWLAELEQETDRFRMAVELLYERLRAVCRFHCGYEKVQHWYSRAICERSLQDLLWSRCRNPDVPPLACVKGGTSADSAWRPALESFLRHHPCPQLEELAQLAQLERALGELPNQGAAAQLTNRCMTLRTVMTSPDSATLHDLQLALQWQYEQLKGNRGAMTTTSDLTLVRDGCAESGGAGVLPRESGSGPCPSARWDTVPTVGKPPSLISFDSGFGGIGSSGLETGSGKEVPEGLPRVPFSKGGALRSPQTEVNVPGIPSVRDGPEPDSLGAGIRIVPRVTADCLNLEIRVTRSATLPQNPWLGLPLDELESSYTVTISPRQQGVQHSPRHASCSLEEAELSPIRNILSSTITDSAGGTETTPTLLWDTYDLHDLKHDSSVRCVRVRRSLCSVSDLSLCDWVLKEEAELQAVEEVLQRTAGILQEEEDALVQEEALSVLLTPEPIDGKWSTWRRHARLAPMSSSGLAEAGVIGLEDDLTSHLQLSHYHDDLSSQGCPEDAGGVCAPSPGPARSPGRGDLLQELKNLQSLDKRIMEENQKLHALHGCGAQSCTEDRRRFLDVLEHEKKEVEGGRKTRLRRGRKVIKCSIMESTSALGVREEDEGSVSDEALLTSCRRQPPDTKHEDQHVTPEELTNHKPSNSATDEAAHCKLGSEVLVTTAESTNNGKNLRQDTYQGSLSSTVLSELDISAAESDASNLQKRDMSDSISVASDPSDLSDVRVSVEEPEKCPGLHDCGLEMETVGTTNHAQCEGSGADPRVEEGRMVQEAGQERAFDPGGSGPLPRPPGSRRPWLGDQANSVSNRDLQESNAHVPAALGGPPVPSAGPKPKARTNPPPRKSQSLPATLGHNNNNNNNNNNDDPHCRTVCQPEHNVTSTEEFIIGSDYEHGDQIDAASDGEIEGLIVGAEPARCEGMTLEVESGSRGVSELSRDRAEHQAAAPVGYDVSTRSSRRSPDILPRVCVPELSDLLTPVVMDTGSVLVKAGFADQELPSIVFPAAIGRPKYEEVMHGSAERDVYVGHETRHMRGVLTLHYPVRNGLVTNWDHMELIWQHAFQQLCVDPVDHPVLLTEGVMVPLRNRQRMAQLMFESFNVPLTYVALQPVLALYAAGRTTGVVFDSGDGLSHSVPVFEGYCLPHAVQRLPLAGADVTLQLKQLLLEQGVCMRTSAELEIVRDIKEKCCHVPLDYEAELSRMGGAGTQMHYTLPDGHVVSLTTERFRAPEILFKPELIGRDHYGMHECIFKSILQSDIDLRKSFLGNVVLCGGNTLLAGLCERLQLELHRLAPAKGSGTVRVLSPPERDFSVWKGGAVLSSLPAFSSAWISREEYEEFGPQIVFRKCF
ncbi:uncharacterized protein LOC113567738 isoform X1 [Electrophorus electricus]|uniref:uncharacterized protein LOC113567738 isoform X1 n=2 Tax=Electrophorus electricus TaxID=8005 RepID=UPI0015CFEF2F|nr:uncharacterized protein LOC113567738 isoform X1 [Electrophorus electricus]